MSASNQKKIRKEKAMAYMSERQRKEAEEQKKLKRYTITFWIVLALCVCIVLSTVLTNPIKNVVYKNTTAVTIGEHELSAAEVNYFYVDAINNFCNQYSYYLSYMLDTSKPLSEQVYDKTTGLSWADNFLNTAIENIKSTYQLYDLAMKDGFKLSDEEKASIDTAMKNIDVYATYYQYNNSNAYLRSVYGNGATVESYRAYYEVCAIANAYYTAHSESLEYDDAALRAYEADKMEQYNSYTFAYYYFQADKFLEGGTKDSNDKVTYSDAEKEAAVKKAEELANKLLAGEYEDLDAFDEAINELLTQHFDKKDENKDTEDDKDITTAPKTGEDETAGDETTDDETTGDETTGDETTGDETTGDETTGDETTDDETTEGEDGKEEDKKPLKYTSTKMEDQLYSGVNKLFIDWLIGKEKTEDEDEKDEDEEENLVVRQVGDLTIIVNETTSGDKTTINGYYVLRFGGVNDNKIQLKDVRHILISFEGGTKDSSGNVTYSDAEKKAAKAKAEKLLEEYKAGEMTEEKFAELAKKNTGDTGSKENGGLYEDVYPGQMVTNFNDWCFDETRKAGDVGIVESEYGYHIMYFVGDSETNYRDYMIENDVRNDELAEWMENLIKTADLEHKNLKYVNKDMVLSAQ